MAKKKTEPAPLQSGGRVQIDLKVYVGEAAGIVWKCLGQYGKLSEDAIAQKTGLEIGRVCMAVGWLAHEGKVMGWGIINSLSGDAFVALTPAEQEIYNRTQREQQRLPQEAELDLWFKLMDELNNEQIAIMLEPGELKQQTELIGQLLNDFDPTDRKLVTLYCKGDEYRELRQEPEFSRVELTALRRRVHDLMNRLRDTYMVRTQSGSQPRGESTNPICAGFALDLTDYATKCRECLPFEKQQSLVEHIIKCPDCRRDFLESQHIFALIFMPPETPESRQKMHDFIARLTKTHFPKTGK
jgi:hypothetical protein